MISLVFRIFHIKRAKLSYVFTFVFFLCYPFITIKIDDYLHPPPPGPRCGTVQMAWVFGSWVLFMPVAMGIQAALNRLLLRSRGKSESEASGDPSTPV